MNLKRAPFVLSGITMAVLLASCGGGGEGSDTATSLTTSSTTSVVSGTVPGTLIEAFCADGTYYHVNSTNDGTSEHPFSISLPNNVNCRLVMTTNENDPINKVVTAIQIDSGLVSSGLLNMSADFDLGYIDLAMDRADIDDVNGDGIKDTPLTVPLSLPDGVVLLSYSSDSLDSDGDDVLDYYDHDDDNDGLSDDVDSDDDGDGIDDVDEVDSDGDGIDDMYDRDDDNDGLSDDVDSDDDGDGISDDDDDDHNDDYDSGVDTVYTPVSEYNVTSGRLLASQCAQCHGTNGSSTNSWDSIAGESASELIEEMQEFKSGEEDEPIMEAQAHGYTDAEIQALASWLATQPSSDNDD